MSFLAFNFTFEDLHSPQGLQRLDQIFCTSLKEGNEHLAHRLEAARQTLPLSIEESALLLDLAPYVEDFIGTLSHIDVAVLNPPRKGCEPAFLEKLALLKPSRLVYVSCDPATLARDLAILKEKGYQVKAVQPFDMFPQTVHVETVALLSSSA